MDLRFFKYIGVSVNLGFVSNELDCKWSNLVVYGYLNKFCWGKEIEYWFLGVGKDIRNGKI